MKKIFYILILSIIFSFLIFYIKNYFFWDIEKVKIKQIEEKYIEPTYKKETEEIKTNSEIKEIIKDKLIKDFLPKKIIEYSYIPKEFEDKCSKENNNLKIFFYTKTIKNKVNEIYIELYENIIDSRWKMKDKTIKIYWIPNLEQEEFLSVFIHEFWHYIDLYYLEKQVINDLSNYFYNISWNSTKIIKAGQKQEDFVSGYSMTNKYEDFAESFTYYVLHNEDFLKKSKKSDILHEKYNFFKNNVFIFEEFENTDFSESNIIKDYYRDITKIDYNIKNFLQYLENLL